MMATGVVLFYFLVYHDRTGVVGKSVARLLLQLFGKCSYLAAMYIFYEGVHLWRHKGEGRRYRLEVLLGTSGFILFLGAVSFVNIILPDIANYAGFVGKQVSGLFNRLFGPAFGFIFNLGLFLYVLSVLKKISFYKIAVNIYEMLKRDIEEYKKVKALSRKLSQAERGKVTKQPAVVTAKEVQPPARIVTQPTAPLVQSSKTGHIGKSTAPVITQTDALTKSDYDGYKIPSPEILPAAQVVTETEKHHIELDRAQVLKKTLEDFGIKVDVKDIIPGPVVTRYDLELEPGVKYESITALTNNLSLALKAATVRVIPVPEKSAVGIEIPNPITKIVGLKDIISSDEFSCSTSPLTFALGQTTDGASYITDIIPMPHLLIAGATGSGKSVCIHSLILSVLFKARPDEVKFILIDPKRLELSLYEGLPHLYDPSVPPEEVRVITQPKKAMSTLKQLVYIMEKRYELFAKFAVRNIDGFNEKARSEPELKLSPVYYILVIIDELADLMLISRGEIEGDIQRLAQMARAVGIHLVLATQRPSVDIITGVIKANFSARIAFQTISKVDSRVILDTVGAEDLLGRGDMLFLPPAASRPIRLQGTFVSSKDAESVVEFIRAQGFKPSYTEYIREEKSDEIAERQKNEKNRQYIISALKLILDRKRVSQDLLKAHFGSSARATDILSLLEKEGFIFKPEGTNRWSIRFTEIQEFLDKEGGVRS